MAVIDIFLLEIVLCSGVQLNYRREKKECVWISQSDNAGFSHQLKQCLKSETEGGREGSNNMADCDQKGEREHCLS